MGGSRFRRLGEGGGGQILYTLKRDHIDKFFKPISTDFIFLFCGLTDEGVGIYKYLLMQYA